MQGLRTHHIIVISPGQCLLIAPECPPPGPLVACDQVTVVLYLL